MKKELVSTKVPKQTIEHIRKLKAGWILATGKTITDPEVIAKCIEIALMHEEDFFVEAEPIEENEATEFTKDINYIH
ncbi:MAG: hypothetical protein ABH803_00315 [Candidatus Micrarchaeota archaeon]